MAKRPYAPGFRISTDVLLHAYRQGIFPMAEDADDPEVFWVRPEARGIIPLDGFYVPRSLEKTVRKALFDIRFDSDFDAVIKACAEKRDIRRTTWINAPIRDAYGELFKKGHCHTVESWLDGKLVGGLYGVTIGGAFFGESMFSKVRDASKVCLVHLVRHLRERHFCLLDTQFTTDHLARFGTIEVTRADYELLLAAALREDATF